MRKVTILLVILTALSKLNIAQNDIGNLNGYKYFFLPKMEYNNGSEDIWGINKIIKQSLINSNLKVTDNLNSLPNEIKIEPCLICTCKVSHSENNVGSAVTAGPEYVYVEFKNCNNEIIYKQQAKASTSWAGLRYAFKTAANKAMKDFYYYRHTFLKNKSVMSKTISELPPVEKTNETESSLTEYYDSNNLEEIEGIYKSMGENVNSYTIGIKKFDDKFKAIIIKSNNEYWKEGEVKIILNLTATKNLYSCKYFMENKVEKEIFIVVENSGFLNFKLGETENNFIKMYPINSTFKNNYSNKNWKGNGSGIILSKTGHIVTNFHVIDDANEIEVEFVLENKVQKFNAEIVQVDKVNDLAVIKIHDMNFDGVESPPYNFKTRISDVGTKVYAFGYPMALSVMGKEIKVTDGIISSKTGFDGDITSYQISAPIQGGNSGGPLFDAKGNLIGINAAKLNAKIADNVGYSIKTSYILNLIDILPKSIDLPSSDKLVSLPLTEQIKEISKYVVLIKVK